MFDVLTASELSALEDALYRGWKDRQVAVCFRSDGTAVEVHRVWTEVYFKVLAG